ncbi:RPGRIP1 family [Phytophthora cactorum]|nr:RPGRIP1 family [Phytophthora cactorum]
MVSRKYGDLPSTASFLDAEEDNSVKHLRNRVHVVQIAHLKAMQELERCEKMLQAQTNINRELALEIEELTTSKISSSNQLQRRMKELELLCEERQQRIHAHQAEIRQLKYAREKLLLKMREPDDECSEASSSDEEESEVASLSESLILAARDLAPGEQILELGIVSGDFDSSVIGVNSSSFVLCDFYDFESQSTPLLMGSRPEYNLSATFKVTVDGFFLRYLASESVLLEVHQAIRGDFKLIGKASLLSTLGKRSETQAPSDVLCDQDFRDNAITNELQITVFACRKLHSYGKRSDGSISRVPSSYAHYQLLGFPDVFTNIVPESASPDSSRQAFALEVDACLLRFLSQFRFGITVFDDQVELDDSAQEDGMIGRCGILLSDLVNGENIRGWFPLKDQNDQHAGDISVLLQWKDPFQVLQLTSSQRARGVNGRPIDMFSLDFDQQHALLSMFSSDMDGRVNYQQFLHYAAPSEELELLVARLKERLEYAVDSELITSVKDALTGGMDASERKRMLISIDTLVQTGEKYGIFLSDAERDLLLSTFGVASISTESGSVVGGDIAKSSGNHHRFITMNYLLLHINPRLSCTERLLCHKIRQTMYGYAQEQRKRKAADTMPAPKLFEKFDETKCGRVTRSAFRKCLSALGFDLMNVESEYRELVRHHTKQSCSMESPNNSIAGNTAILPQDRIDLDEDVLEDTKAKQQPKQPATFSDDSRKKSPKILTQNDPNYTAKTVPATTEFQRRKQAFMDRMKAIASASSKNLVYEQVEKKLQDQRVQAKERGSKVLSRQERLEQQVKQLHIPQNIHHDAARTLQRQYRQYKEQRQQQRETSCVKTTIMEADLQLQSILSKWTFADLREQEDSVLAEIERDVPVTKRSSLLTKKQLGYFLSKAPRIVLPPALLWQLMDYFSVKETGMVAYRSLLNFIFSTSTEEDEREKKQRLSVLRRLLFDVGNASHTFVSAGDMNETGPIPKELHLVTIMFDANGYEILYHALLQTLTQLPHCQQLAEALERCLHFGISSLREKILTFVNSDDGLMTQEELLRVLMQPSSEGTQFEPKDASLLFEMVGGNSDTTKQISIQDLCLRLEAATKYSRKSISDEWNKYDMHYLQRLAWNCRKFICGSYSDMKHSEELRCEDKCLVRYQLSTVFGLDDTTSTSRHGCCREEARKAAHEQANKLPSRQLSEVFAHWNQIFLTEKESASEGVISRSIFVKACNTRLSISLDENEMRTLLYTYDPELKDQVDCSAFLKMNWREATITYQKRAQVINDVAKAKTIVTKIGEKLQDQKGAPRQIAEAFSYNGDSSDSLVESDDVHSLFVAFGEQPDKRKMDFVKFFKDSFGLLVFNSSEIKPDYQLSAENEKRLRRALEAAFQEFCVLHRFAEIAPSKLWRQMEANGLVELLPRRAVGLLSQKFSTTFYDDDGCPYAPQGLLKRRTGSHSTAKTPRTPITTLSAFLESCDERGVDFRGELEARDSTYTGYVTAMELKEILLRLGIAKSASSSSAEAVIGQLVRQFRSTEQTDAVHYTEMLYEATKPAWPGSDSRYDQNTEHLRSQIRVKANLAGQIDHSDQTNYASSNTTQHTGAQHVYLPPRWGRLSRTEFDSFVIDPYAARMLKKISDRLYSEGESQSQDKMPRVAYLSRLLMECGGYSHQSSLPAETFWTQLERALERQVTTLEKLRLQHLSMWRETQHCLQALP